MAHAPLDLNELRTRLQAGEGAAYWRGLNEIVDDEAVADAVLDEFPEGASEGHDAAGRRRFLKLMTASLALAGVSRGGCRDDFTEQQRIAPYVDPPPDVEPDRPLFYATAFLLGGYAEGVLVKSRMGRPIKVEGNPDHPDSLGATDAFAQASILDLYDPERAKNILHRGAIRTWRDLTAALHRVRERHRSTRGAGLRLLTETVTSPTLEDQIRRLLRDFPQARWHQYDPSGRTRTREGLRLALGRPAAPVYHFRAADVVLSLDADFLSTMPGHVRYAADFADRRRVRADRTAMNRLYAVESTPTLAGAMADHRYAARPSRITTFAYVLAHALGVGPPLPPDAGLPPGLFNWLPALTAELTAHPGASLVVAGETQPPAVHALAHRINRALGNVGRTVDYIDPPEAEPSNPQASLRDLTRDTQDGAVDTLVILGGNPAYTAPADVPFAQALEAVPTTLHLSLYRNKTSALCDWLIPETHVLEAWGDARAFDGTATILQPLIAPLYKARSAYDVLALLLDTPGRNSYDAVRAYWRAQHEGDNFEGFWRQAIHDGVVPGTGVLTGLPPLSLPGAVGTDPTETPDPTEPSSTPAPGALEAETAGDLPPLEPTDDEAALELVFRLDPTIWDGRFARNGWLQELPKPLTKLVWGNAALLSPRTAERYGLRQGQAVELDYEGRHVQAPVWIMPGHADGCVTLYLGHASTGRDGVPDGLPAGRPGGGGVNAYRLRTAGAPWSGAGLVLHPLETTSPPVSTQEQSRMHGSEPVRTAPIERFVENPHFLDERHSGDLFHELPTLYPEYDYLSYRWGMVIDLGTCIGCNACVVACQSENNIPIVGPDEVRRGRRMHWLRIDRYYSGDLDAPETHFQPVPCMHCEKAPCEVVCPVYATVHDTEGINVMVYNRCVGTRYCSNNCPYKVRRFNFLAYADWTTESLKLRRNPDVTVRERGVMEKCTYCVQRIKHARVEAEAENRRIRDGEVMTACQMACPTRAIVFGDLNDQTSAVRRLADQPHNYALLHELGTQPRTTYLAHLRNPNEPLRTPPRDAPPGVIRDADSS